MLVASEGPSAARADPGPPAIARVDDVAWVPLACNLDERGRLVEIDFHALPFTVRRVFTITDVPAGTTRGGHRHRSGMQVLRCVSGRIEVELRRSEERTVVVLTPETDALCIPAGVWSAQRYVDANCALVVLASEPFDPSSYETSY